MKILSIIVPCYNSEDYMENCIKSLLIGGNDVEILIINDGSADNTKLIADELQAKHPEIIRAIHQENAGHGGAINTGIANAKGKYIKVVDSDDWVDRDAYFKILDQLRTFVANDQEVDLLVSNFVYEKDGVKHKMVMKYTSVLPQNRIITWDETKRFRKGRYLLMHSVIYSADLLHSCGLKLPEHTFYVDNIYVYVPMKYVKTMYYLNVDFYRYYIGREDQSVNEAIMIKRIDQQIKVNKIMLDVNLEEIENKKQRKYMLNYFEIISLVTSVLLTREGSDESIQKKKGLWRYIRKKSPWVYSKLMTRFFCFLMNVPGRVSRYTVLGVYKISQKIVGFN